MGAPANETKTARARRRKYNRDIKRRYLAEMEANPKDPRHGTNAGYTYGCRCHRCCVAQKAYWTNRARYLRKRREVRKRAL